MHDDCSVITKLILSAAEDARKETSGEAESPYTQKVEWPVSCTVGPGLEGAIACESSVGYVNGSKGLLIYRGYDIFDLCAHSTFEEVSYLLLHGNLPTAEQLETYQQKLVSYRYVPKTMRVLMGFPIEELNTMAALRLGTLFLRQKKTLIDQEAARPDIESAIGSDEDSIPMEIAPYGEPHAIYEFKRKASTAQADDAASPESCYHLISGVATIAAAIRRIRDGNMPIEPDPDLSHAGNFLYMLTGRRPTPVEERVMDIALILHADHGMNASTFACMVVASTLSDIYSSVDAGIGALNGPLHGGANELALRTLRSIGGVGNVKGWFEQARASKQKIMGFGHRVYKAYDPRARVLGPLSRHLAEGNPDIQPLFETARALECEVASTLGVEKKIFPNVDFFSGLVYTSMGIPPELFTPVFAVSRVSGWTARVLEYLENNRIFRPRAMYVGPFGKKYVPLEGRSDDEADEG
ncbi:MAG: citrate/2-methylcitrate synthase [Planctomycetes bacterium]|nr:citrate/2-methylcitrate synthase [Planctomycetota bacterium]